MAHWISQDVADATILALGGLLVVVLFVTLAWSRRRRETFAGLRALRDLAKRQGGTVVMNDEGQPQWRVPFYGATLVVGYRTTKGVTKKSTPLPWTRVALEVPGLQASAFRGILMQERHAPNANVWRALAPLREISAWGPLKILISPDDPTPTVEIWRFGWGRQDVHWIEQTLVYSLDVLLDLTRTVCENPYDAKSLRESLTTCRIFKKPFLTMEGAKLQAEPAKSALGGKITEKSRPHAQSDPSTQTETHNYQRLPADLALPADRREASASMAPQSFLS